VPEGIDLRVIGACLVSIQQLLNTGERHLWNWLPVFVVHEAVEQRAERRFYRCVLRADQDAAVFCLGTYTGVVSDAELRKITVDYTIEFARVCRDSSPLRPSRS
jgi:hypothetical protein